MAGSAPSGQFALCPRIRAIIRLTVHARTLELAGRADMAENARMVRDVEIYRGRQEWRPVKRPGGPS